MEHHETPTARALKLTVHMVAVLFGADLAPRGATRKAMLARGLFEVEDDHITITPAGSAAREAIETEVLQASRAVTVAPPITVELPSGESLAVPSVVLGDEDETPVPVVRTVRARDVKPGMTIGLVESGAPLREVVVSDVRESGADLVILAGPVEVRTGPLTLFALLNDGSLFEVPDVIRLAS